MIWLTTLYWYDKLRYPLSSFHWILNGSGDFFALCFPNHAIPIFDEIWGRFWVQGPHSNAAAAPCKLWRASQQTPEQEYFGQRVWLEFQGVELYEAKRLICNSAFWNETVCNICCFWPSTQQTSNESCVPMHCLIGQSACAVLARLAVQAFSFLDHEWWRQAPIDTKKIQRVVALY